MNKIKGCLIDPYHGLCHVPARSKPRKNPFLSYAFQTNSSDSVSILNALAVRNFLKITVSSSQVFLPHASRATVVFSFESSVPLSQ